MGELLLQCVGPLPVASAVAPGGHRDGRQREERDEGEQGVDEREQNGDGRHGRHVPARVGQNVHEHADPRGITEAPAEDLAGRPAVVEGGVEPVEVVEQPLAHRCGCALPVADGESVADGPGPGLDYAQTNEGCDPEGESGPVSGDESLVDGPREHGGSTGRR